VKGRVRGGLPAIGHHQQMPTNSADPSAAQPTAGYFWAKIHEADVQMLLTERARRAPPFRPTISKFHPSGKGGLRGLVLAVDALLAKATAGGPVRRSMAAMAADELLVAAAGCPPIDGDGRGVSIVELPPPPPILALFCSLSAQCRRAGRVPLATNDGG
jgi:hypothetical protein